MRRVLFILVLVCSCVISHAQTNIITTIAGTGIMGYSGDNGPAINAQLHTTEGICRDKWDNLYIADAENNKVRKINIATGIITSIAGKTIAGGYSGDGGPATNAELGIPCGVVTDTAGNVYIADGANNRVRKVDASTGIISTIAGNGIMAYSGDNGPATNASLFVPTGLRFDNVGNLYISDWGNNRVRKVDATTGIITTFAGNSVSGYTGDGGPATDAGINGPIQVFVDNSGNIFIADQWNGAIRKVNIATGIITTVAGTGVLGYSGDNGPATAAQLDQPTGVFVDSQNNIFVAEYANGTIRKVDGLTGIITTVAGTGTLGYSGDGGPATNAQLACGDVLLDSHGVMFIADMDNHRIRRVGPRDNTGVPDPSCVVVTNSRVAVWPNPAHDEVMIENGKGSEMTIYNLVGQQVHEAAIATDKERIDIRHLVPGVYMLSFVKGDGSKEVLRLVKE